VHCKSWFFKFKIFKTPGDVTLNEYRNIYAGEVAYSLIQRISTKDNELQKIMSVSVKRRTDAKHLNFSSSIEVGSRSNLNLKN